MVRIRLQAERYSELGNISASGIGKILGTPQHNALRIVLRETVQNSWDAKLPGRQVAYRVRLRSLHDPERDFLSRHVFRELPENKHSADAISGFLRCTNAEVLEIADTGTRGLGGPSRADVAIEAGESGDFAEFIRNVGSPRDTDLGGGTYGYGKASLYRMSKCRSILVHSHAVNGGEQIRRFIGCHLGDQFNAGGKRLTGRHWWGTIGKGSVVDPVEGEDADVLAAGLGCFVRDPYLRGTTILILAPDFDGRSREQIVGMIQETLLWSFWPKLLGRRPAMRFEVEIDGSSVPLPRLEDCPPLPAYAAAMERIKSDSDDVITIQCLRPKQTLGALAVEKTVFEPRHDFGLGDESEIPARSSHVALMRPAELVVKYMELDALPSEKVEFAGVFICDSEVEPAFAAAEPPAHDDWVPAYLSGKQKKFVNVALREIRNCTNDVLGVRREGTAASAGIAVAALSESLGELLIGQKGERTGGWATERTASPSGAAPRRRRMTITGPRASGLRVVDGRPCALFSVAVACEDNASVRLLARAELVMEGGRTAEPSAGDPQADVLGWYDAAFASICAGATLTTHIASSPAQFYAAVSLPPDAAILLKLEELEA
jgi:hypothetical protein